MDLFDLNCPPKMKDLKGDNNMSKSPYFPGCEAMRASYFENRGDDSKTVQRYPDFSKKDPEKETVAVGDELVENGDNID